MAKKTTGKKNSKPSFIEEARRKQILEIAMNRIINYGYENFSIQEIANEANVTKGVIYYHFKGKEELIGTLFANINNELFEYRAKLVEKQKSAVKKLETHVLETFAFLTQNHNKLVAILKIGLDLKSPKASKNLFGHEATGRCNNFIEKILSDGIKSGEFLDIDPKSAAPIIQAAADGLLLQWLSGAEGLDLNKSRDILIKMVLSYVKAD